MNEQSPDTYYMIETEFNLDGKSQTELHQETSRPWAIASANLKLELAKDYFKKQNLPYDSYITKRNKDTDTQIITVFSSKSDNYIVIRFYTQPIEELMNS